MPRANKNTHKTECLRGHPLSGDNLRVRNGTRECRECIRLRARRRENKTGLTAQQWQDLHRKHRQMSMRFPLSEKEKKSSKSRHKGFAKVKARAFVDALKSSPCVDCSQSLAPCAMDFDHLDGSTKKASISTLVERGASRGQIEAEIAKCELVCANCHRVRTTTRMRGRAGDSVR